MHAGPRLSASRNGCSPQRSTSATSCRRCSPACGAQRRRSRSPIRPPRARRRGLRERRCSFFNCYSVCNLIGGVTPSKPLRPRSSRRGPGRSGCPASARSTASGMRASKTAKSASKRHDRLEMKIAILAPVWFAVPPIGYGGIEWIVWLLADGLVDAGHDVTLFASGDSRTKAELAAVFPEAPSRQIGRTFWELRHALSCFARADEFDVINDHTGMLGATLGATTRTPVVHTVHGPLDGEPGEIYELIAKVAPQVGLISISMNQRKPKPDLNWIANCPNALDFSVYPCKPHRGEYLGEVTHGEKVELLQNARATLFPIEWEEPFGLVMIESMACGTPVIATR